MSTVFNVDRFKAALTNGGVRPNQFAVFLSFPTYVGAQALAVARAPFLVTAAELPGQDIGPATVFYRGREVKFAGDRVFAPWTITVLNDSDFSIRTAMEQWMNGMEDLVNKSGRLNPSAYQRDLEVYQLDRNGAVLKGYKLVSAFPSNIAPVPLDFGANDQISNFTVTWQFQHFTVSNAARQQILDIGSVFSGSIPVVQ
jgi:hypothetical protein